MERWASEGSMWLRRGALTRRSKSGRPSDCRGTGSLFFLFLSPSTFFFRLRDGGKDNGRTTTMTMTTVTTKTQRAGTIDITFIICFPSFFLFARLPSPSFHSIQVFFPSTLLNGPLQIFRSVCVRNTSSSPRPSPASVPYTVPALVEAVPIMSFLSSYISLLTPS